MASMGSMSMSMAPPPLTQGSMMSNSSHYLPQVAGAGGQGSSHASSTPQSQSIFDFDTTRTLSPFGYVDLGTLTFPAAYLDNRLVLSRYY
eukprot:1258119-Amorphochlora_amoeboformis.AAC.2